MPNITLFCTNTYGKPRQMTMHMAMFCAIARSRTYTSLGEAFPGELPKGRAGNGVLHVDQYVQARVYVTYPTVAFQQLHVPWATEFP